MDVVNVNSFYNLGIEVYFEDFDEEVVETIRKLVHEIQILE